MSRAAGRRADRRGGALRLSATLIVGLVLVLPSAPSFFSLMRESHVGSVVASRYEWKPASDSNSISLGENTLVVRDELEQQDYPEDWDLWIEAPVQTLINGEDHSVDSAIPIRAGIGGANRYWRSLRIGVLNDRELGEEQLVVVQRTFPTARARAFPEMRFRVLRVRPSGEVVEDRFRYDERATPPHRAWFAREAVPHPSGDRTNEFLVYPNPIFPLVYPFVTFIVGALLVLVGLWRTARRARQEKCNESDSSEGDVPARV